MMHRAFGLSLLLSVAACSDTHLNNPHSWLKHMTAAAKMETVVDSSHLNGDGEEPNGAPYDGDADGSELDSSLA